MTQFHLGGFSQFFNGGADLPPRALCNSYSPEQLGLITRTQCVNFFNQGISFNKISVHFVEGFDAFAQEIYLFGQTASASRNIQRRTDWSFVFPLLKILLVERKYFHVQSIKIRIFRLKTIVSNSLQGFVSELDKYPFNLLYYCTLNN